MNIYFCGLIGSGKTTIGERLSQELGLGFLDLDQVMDGRLGYSFHRLVAEQGWLPFRELEYNIMKYFAAQERTVVCLGGGTVRYEWNNDAIRGTGPVILLNVPIETIIDRIRHNDRPRVNPGTDLAKDLEIMWTKDRHKYFDAADIVYDCAGKTLDEEVAEIKEMVMTDPRFRGVRPADNLSQSPAKNER
jgi:shikimate kinase